MRPIPVGPEIDSFYHLSGQKVEHKVCRGVSCFAAQARNPERWKQAMWQVPPVYCLGKCYASPASTDEDPLPPISIRCKNPVVLQGFADGDIQSLSNYLQAGGYGALKKALQGSPEDVVKAVERSALRGRGGAGYPAGKKWRAVFAESKQVKYVVANADEGDHGSYIDRFIMELAPHRLLEAMLIAAWAIGASKGYIYLRKEYPRALDSLKVAIIEARDAGYLGKTIFGASFDFDVEIVIGQGSYVCGEETSLLNSIEHVRPEVRARPPFPTAAGLFGKPTLVNNVETFASVPWIVQHSGEAYASMGFSKSRGTKAVSLNSLFKYPGLYEVEFGIPLRTIIEDIGGGLQDDKVKALIIGGPLTGVIHPREFGVPLAFEELHDIGGSIGHGGFVAFGQNTNLLALLAHAFVFGANESCGKCTPCRLGTRKLESLLGRASEGKGLGLHERHEIQNILGALQKTSLCGHGSGLADLAQGLMMKFPEEFESCLP